MAFTRNSACSSGLQAMGHSGLREPQLLGLPLPLLPCPPRSESTLPGKERVELSTCHSCLWQVICKSTIKDPYLQVCNWPVQ